MTISIFLFLKTKPEWLALSRERRNDIATSSFDSAFRDAPIEMRYFDAEAFSGRCTDIAMIETDDITQYYFCIEKLRDTPLFSFPYFDIVDIIPTIEDGFRTFEQAEQAIS